MNFKLATLALVLVLPYAAAAVEKTPAKAGYQLKNRSSFAPAEEPRTPFWPIGWSKRIQKTETAVAAAPVAAKSSLDPSQFKITSILLGSPSLAVINGRAYGEGEFLKVPRAAATAPAANAAAPQPAARVRVQQITDSTVVLQSGEQSLTVPFHRPGLAAKQAGRDLLLEDR
jgi:hypothetical protein